LGVALSQGAASGEAEALELARTPWAAAFKVGDSTEDDEEAEVCNTLERGLAWARRTFDDLILLVTSVSFLAWVTCFFDFLVLPRSVTHSCIARGRPLRHQVGGEHARHMSSAGRQFSQVSNQLQVVSEEVTRLRESNAKLSEDLEGDLRGCFPSSSPSPPVSCRILIR
jgi:hypothetical protein